MKSTLRTKPAVRVLLVLAVLAVVGLALFSFRSGSSWGGARADSSKPFGTIDTDTARAQGAKLGEQAVAATEKATHKMQETIAEAGITTKIKAKMALDESARARDIDVTTHGSIVTLDGSVRSVAEHDRAIALARETAGVREVVDHMCVQLWRQ
jgi:hyperosmotically inducible periplasmic protein